MSRIHCLAETKRLPCVSCVLVCSIMQIRSDKRVHVHPEIRVFEDLLRLLSSPGHPSDMKQQPASLSLLLRLPGGTDVATSLRAQLPVASWLAFCSSPFSYSCFHILDYEAFLFSWRFVPIWSSHFPEFSIRSMLSAISLSKLSLSLIALVSCLFSFDSGGLMGMFPH